MQYKTIKQISDELGVSKQQVYRYVKKNHIKEAHQVNGTLYYDEVAEKLVTQGFSKKAESAEADQRCTNETAVDAVIALLKKELEAKDRQIEELQAALKREQELHTSAQRLHDQAQQLHLGSIAQLEAAKSEEEPVVTAEELPTKKGWFGWKKTQKS